MNPEFELAKCKTRVELSPATDWWMRGARLGTVMNIVRRGKNKGKVAIVKLDVNDRLIRIPTTNFEVL